MGNLTPISAAILCISCTVTGCICFVFSCYKITRIPCYRYPGILTHTQYLFYSFNHSVSTGYPVPGYSTISSHRSLLYYFFLVICNFYTHIYEVITFVSIFHHIYMFMNPLHITFYVPFTTIYSIK